MKRATWTQYDKEELRPQYRQPARNPEDLKTLRELRTIAHKEIDPESHFLVKRKPDGEAEWTSGTRDEIMDALSKGVGGTSYNGLSYDGRERATRIAETMDHHHPRYGALIKRLNEEFLLHNGRSNGKGTNGRHKY